MDIHKKHSKHDEKKEGNYYERIRDRQTKIKEN